MADSRPQENKKIWTVDDLMKTSELISEGTPARYRLLTTRSNLDESGEIRKWTFGQREINTQNKIILLVGETGTGKTTLINAIVNYTLGVKFEDQVWFEITEDSRTGSQSEDQTKPQSEDQTKPQPEDQTEHQSEDQTKPQSEDQTKPQSEDQTEPQSEDQTKGQSEDQTEHQSEDQTEPQSEDQTKRQSEDQTKPQSEDQTEHQSEDQTEHQSEDQTKPQSEDQTENKTTEITVYEVFGQNNPISVTIIDTPGYGDTRGLEHDKMIAVNLLKLFKNDTGVKEINAVCLVVKASQNRLSDSQRYIFDAVLSLFGKDIEENIVISVTHSNGMPPKSVISVIKELKIPCRKTNGTDPVYFLFDNCQAEEQTTEYEEVYKRAWELTEKSLKKFFTSLEDQKRKSLEMTGSVLTEQIILQECVSNLCQHIKLKEHKLKELTQIQKNTESTGKKEAELSAIQAETPRLLLEACITIIQLSKIALKPDSAFIVETLDFLIRQAEECERPEWVQKLKELK